MQKQILIIGAGGHGKELLAYCRDLKIEVYGLIDDRKPKGLFAGSCVLGTLDELEKIVDTSAKFQYITAVGDNELRKRLVERIEALSAKNLSAWTLRHPTSYLGAQIEIGPGTCLAPNSLMTTHVSIGKHCIVNVKASVSHDSVIGDFVNLNPNATICGNVKIGTGCYIGAGATVIDGISIGDWTVIGAGAVVTKDIPSRVTAVGVPARIIKQQVTV